MKRLLLSLCLILLIGCSPALTATPLSTPLTDTPVPALDSSQQCAYMWATQSLNDLTLDFQASLKKLNPDADGYAYAFGEDCIYQDGHKTFGAMETDFNVTMPVKDLTDENALGEWMVKVVNVIDDLPAEKIAGPKAGKVSVFFASGTEQKAINFYIDKYRTLDPGMSGLEIYQALLAMQ